LQESTSPALVAEGQRVFRLDTFGDEQIWTDKLRQNEVVEKNVDPTTALKVGLKVDADVLPRGVLDKVDLKSPATTVALLKMNAVVGIQATVDSNNHVTRLGITCALCHSTVDSAILPGIGRRKDGWPNRDLNVGPIHILNPLFDSTEDISNCARDWYPRIGRGGKRACLQDLRRAQRHNHTPSPGRLSTSRQALICFHLFDRWGACAKVHRRRWRYLSEC
jgi:hypothetical protein